MLRSSRSLMSGLGADHLRSAASGRTDGNVDLHRGRFTKKLNFRVKPCGMQRCIRFKPVRVVSCPVLKISKAAGFFEAWLAVSPTIPDESQCVTIILAGVLTPLRLQKGFLCLDLLENGTHQSGAAGGFLQAVQYLHSKNVIHRDLK